MGVFVIGVVSGCMDVKTEVTVHPDGSGTVVDTLYTDANTPPMMQQMMKGMVGALMGTMEGHSPEEQQKLAGAGEALSTSFKGELKHGLDYERYLTKSKAMGEGVRFVSAEKLSDRIDKMGVKVVYEFDDIRNLRLTFMPTDMPADSTVDAMPEKNPITFDFEEGVPSHLIINIPQQKTDQDETPAADLPSDATPEPNPAQVALMRQFFGDFRVRILITVIGAITETNALYVEKKAGRDEGDTVVLMDMNIGGMLSNPEGLKKLIAYGPMRDIEEARTRLKHIEELKFETNNQVAVFFQ